MRMNDRLVIRAMKKASEKYCDRHKLGVAEAIKYDAYWVNVLEAVEETHEDFV